MLDVTNILIHDLLLEEIYFFDDIDYEFNEGTFTDIGYRKLHSVDDEKIDRYIVRWERFKKLLEIFNSIQGLQLNTSMTLNAIEEIIIEDQKKCRPDQGETK